MTNIPTELLRALIAVVDQKSFTKAAAVLGVTQPAVSAQIKRLHVLLGCKLLDRSAYGIALTPQGELVASHARRLLSINDQIVRAGGDAPRPALVIRVGTPSDFVASLLPGPLARFRERWPHVGFSVRTDFFDALLRDLRSGALDLLIGLSINPPVDARHYWAQETVWVRGHGTEVEPDRPVPLVSYGDPCIYRRVATQALKTANIEWEDVFIGPSIMSLNSAVVSGLGVMPLTRRRACDLDLLVWEDSWLPKLPDLHTGIYVRKGGANAAYEQLADEIADVVNPHAAEPAQLLRMRVR